MADVLGDEHEHDGNEHRQDGEVDLRGVEVRQADPRGLADGGEIDLAAAACVGIADDHTKKNVQAPHQTLEQHSHQQHGHQGDDGGVGRDLEVVPHAWSEVEADDGHNGAVDDRWHDDVNPLGTRIVHDNADQSQQQAGDHDAEGRDGDALMRGGDRSDRGDEAERRTQVARQHIPVDQQEQRRGHGGEEQRGGRVEACQDRHQEGGTEHGDHMLCTDFGGTRPSQALIGFYDLARQQRLAVAMQVPLENITHLFSQSGIRARLLPSAH